MGEDHDMNGRGRVSARGQEGQGHFDDMALVTII